jgi:type VI secretion system protein ImpH
MRNTAHSLASVPVPAATQRVHATLQHWREGAWGYDYFAVMRRLDAVSYPQPRWGQAALPSAEAIRVGQEPSLAFAPAALSRLEDATPHSLYWA